MPEETDIGMSVTADFSDLRPRQQDLNQEIEEDDAIYEMPDEDEHASSPPRSLSDAQDIMSENIESRLQIHKFPKQTRTPTVVHENMSDAVSKEVHESTVGAKLLP